MIDIVVSRPFDTAAMGSLVEADGLRVVVLDEGEALRPGRLAERCADARGLLSMVTDSIDLRFLQACPQLEIVSNMAVGFDNIDVEAATDRGILVCNTPDVLTETTAELAIGLLFAVSRRIAEADRYVRAGRWKTWAPDMLLGKDVFGARLGIVGAGRIGSAVARRGRALGMEVAYASRSKNQQLEQDTSARRLDLDDLFATSDVVSLHAPLTAETRGMVDERRIASMKQGAILINTARGGLVREEALAAALLRGALFGAGLDVFENEPAVSSELLDCPTVVLAPHIGSASEKTRRDMAELAVANLIRYFDGEWPSATVNGERLLSP